MNLSNSEAGMLLSILNNDGLIDNKAILSKFEPIGGTNYSYTSSRMSLTISAELQQTSILSDDIKFLTLYLEGWSNLTHKVPVGLTSITARRSSKDGDYLILEDTDSEYSLTIPIIDDIVSTPAHDMTVAEKLDHKIGAASDSLNDSLIAITDAMAGIDSFGYGFPHDPKLLSLNKILAAFRQELEKVNRELSEFELIATTYDSVCTACDHTFTAVTDRISPCPKCGAPVMPCNACVADLSFCGTERCPHSNSVLMGGSQ